MKSPAEFAVKRSGFSVKELKKHTDAIIGIQINESQKEKLKRKGGLEWSWIDFSWDTLKDEYPRGQLDPIVEDFIIISLAVFYSDSIVKRDETFSREIKLYVPVSDKGLWDSVKLKLERTISFMTYDAFEFEFLQQKGLKRGRNILNQKSEYSLISLFSGGLDSLAGAFYLLEEKTGHKPLFVSVKHGNFGKIIETLLKKLKIDALEFGYSKPKNENKLKKRYRKYHKVDEWTQFSRSFLYLTVGTAVALAHKNIREIYISENGTIANNIGLGEARKGTRTVNPKFLQYFEELVNSIFPNSGIKMKNPFMYQTKGEVLYHLMNGGELIRDSISCARYSRYPNKQCGMCIPCIYRIIALVSKKLYSKYDRRISDQGMNIFLSNLLKPNINTELTEGNVSKISKFTKDDYPIGVINVLDVLRFAANIKKLERGEVIREYPELIDDKLYRMYKKFSEEVESTVNYFKGQNPSLKSAWYDLLSMN